MKRRRKSSRSASKRAAFDSKAELRVKLATSYQRITTLSEVVDQTRRDAAEAVKATLAAAKVAQQRQKDYTTIQTFLTAVETSELSDISVITAAEVTESGQINQAQFPMSHLRSVAKALQRTGWKTADSAPATGYSPERSNEQFDPPT